MTAMLPQEFRGKVVSGDGRGRQIGFPTANIDVADQQLSAIKCGVYDARVSRLGEEFVAIANLGRRPTFDGEQLRLEVHLLDFSCDLYGAEVDVLLLSHLRDEQAFETVDALSTQIRADIVEVRKRQTIEGGGQSQ